MYNNHRDLKTLMGGEPVGRIQTTVMKYFNKFLTTDPATVTYRSHLRVIEQIQKDENGLKIHTRQKTLKAKELTLDIIEHDLPDELMTPKEIRAFKRRKKSTKKTI